MSPFNPPPAVPPTPDAGAHARPTPTARRPLALGELIAWTLITITIPAIFIVGMIRKDTRGTQSNPQLAAISRYAIGWKEMFQLPATATADLLKQVDDAVQSPADQVRAAIVRGELLGRQAAIDRLEILLPRHPELADDITRFLAIYRAADTNSAADTNPAVEMPTTDPALRQRWGWFLDLALSCGQPATDPHRIIVHDAALRTVITLLAVMILGLGAAGVGLILLVIGLIFLVLKRLPIRFPAARPLPPDRRTYLYGFAFYLAGMASFGYILYYGLHVPRALAQFYLPLAFLPAFIWPLIAGQSPAHWSATLGLHTGRGILREIAAGLLGYLAGLPIIIAGMIITIILIKLSHADASHPITDELTGDRLTLVLIFFLACVYAPFTEELMFRGALLGHLRQRLPWWISAPLVSLIFAAIHPQGWAGIPVLGAIALVLAAIREWRGSILGCMAAHALNNAVALTVAILTMR